MCYKLQFTGCCILTLYTFYFCHFRRVSLLKRSKMYDYISNHPNSLFSTQWNKRVQQYCNNLEQVRGGVFNCKEILRLHCSIILWRLKVQWFCHVYFYFLELFCSMQINLGECKIRLYCQLKWQTRYLLQAHFQIHGVEIIV